METITLTSKRGLAVTMPVMEHAEWIAKCGNEANARAKILNAGGRILKHRQTLADYTSQRLTPTDRQNIERLAKSYAIAGAIRNELSNMGYDSYLRHAERGGMMPDSWDRTVSEARERISDLDITAQDYDRERAMADLGFLTEADREWSEKITLGCTWEIIAPADWNVSHPIAGTEQG